MKGFLKGNEPSLAAYMQVPGENCTAAAKTHIWLQHRVENILRILAG